MRWILGGLAVLGLWVASWTGLHQDEALFLKAIDHPDHCAFPIRGEKAALMIMPYVGTLKAGLFAGYLKIVPVSVEAVRWPMVGILCLVALLSLRAWGRVGSVALPAALLLAHPLFVLPVVLDWGPVGLQLLLGSLAVWAVIGKRHGWFGFCLGLMVWDKAVAIWLIAGVGGAALLFYPRELLRRRWGRLGFGFLCGAAPYLYYTVNAGRVTALDGNGVAWEQIEGKLVNAVSSLDGSAMISYLFAGGLGERNWGLLGAFAFALAFGLWRRERLALFLWTAVAMAVFAMMITRNAGGSIHHQLLVWPVLGLAVAVSLRGLPWPKVAVAFLLLAQCLAWWPYVRGRETRGLRREWTDATPAVVAELARPGGCPAGIYALDWGFTDNLNGLGRGKFRIDMPSEGWWRPGLTDGEQAKVREHVSDPQACILAWADGPPFFPGTAQAAEPVVRNRPSKVFLDGKGREMIRLWRER